MLEHLDPLEARTFLAEAQRLLMTGGVLRVAVPDLLRRARRCVEGAVSADEFVASTLLANAKPHSFRDRLSQLVVGPRHDHWIYTTPDPGRLDLREREEESVYIEGRRP